MNNKVQASILEAVKNLRPSLSGDMKTAGIVERLLGKATEDEQTGCWNWTAAVSNAGYGQFGFEGKVQTAHRVSYKIFVDEIQPGLVICHRCDNRRCINPSHLFVGTVADNSADMAAKNRSTHGTKNYSAKLSEKDVLAIFSDPRTHRSIGAAYGVSNPTVWSIKSGKTWARVTGGAK